jgi:hypothetical protein
MTELHETILQNALQSTNPEAILNVAQSFSDVSDTHKSLALIKHLFYGIHGESFGFGADYTAIQQRLNNLGATPPLVVDGQWGAKSKAALIAFQKLKGLTPDGVPGPITLTALGLSGTTPAPIATGPATELPATSTPMDAARMADALAAGYKVITGKGPTPQILGLMLGQVALETGNFGHGVHQYNFGNKKYSSGDPHWQFFRCSEIVNGKEVFYDPPSPVCKFAAYDNPAQAGAAYVHTLKSRQHWWDGLQTGTPEGFIAGLTTAPKYFTANPGLYLKGVKDRMNNYGALAIEYAKKYSVAAAGIGLGAILLFALGVFLFRKPLGLVSA